MKNPSFEDQKTKVIETILKELTIKEKELGTARESAKIRETERTKTIVEEIKVPSLKALKQE